MGERASGTAGRGDTSRDFLFAMFDHPGPACTRGGDWRYVYAGLVRRIVAVRT